MNKDLIQKRLKELLDYNSETGIFTWKVNHGIKIKAGSTAGTCSPNCHITIGIDNKLYFAHRLAFLYMEGYFPENMVDHINRVKDDNRWENLRHASKQCNARNCAIRNTNKSGVTGVYWNKQNKKWISQITINKEGIYLGCFDGLRDAAQARWVAEVKYNFPNCNTTSSAFTYLEGSK